MSQDPKQELNGFEQRAQQVLRESAERLDGQTRSRLTQARHAALAAAKQQRHRWTWWAPVSGAVAATVLAVIMLLQRPAGDVAAPTASVDALDIIVAEDPLDFYRDMDFYSWLATQDDAQLAVPEA